MNFMFEWQELTCNVLLLYKRADDAIFDDFPKIFDHFPRISEDFFIIVPKARQTFLDIFRTFPKITGDCQGLPKMTEEDPKMFQSYANKF